MSDLESLVEEARRQLTICDSCRYCEGYCPTFPALERGGLSSGDIIFLANVCHDCRACLQACMYAPPHEFAVTVPASLSAVRTSGYGTLVWPSGLSKALEHPVITKSVALTVGLAFAVSGFVLHGSALFAAHTGSGSFYRVIPSTLLTGFFLGLSALVLVVLAGSLVRFWAVTRSARPSAISWVDVVRALWSAALLKNLRGGGDGCFTLTRSDPRARGGSFTKCSSTAWQPRLLRQSLLRSNNTYSTSFPPTLSSAPPLSLEALAV